MITYEPLYTGYLLFLSCTFILPSFGRGCLGGSEPTFVFKVSYNSVQGNQSITFSVHSYYSQDRHMAQSKLILVYMYKGFSRERHSFSYSLKLLNVDTVRQATISLSWGGREQSQHVWVPEFNMWIINPSPFYLLKLTIFSAFLNLFFFFLNV